MGLFPSDRRPGRIFRTSFRLDTHLLRARDWHSGNRSNHSRHNFAAEHRKYGCFPHSLGYASCPPFATSVAVTSWHSLACNAGDAGRCGRLSGKYACDLRSPTIARSLDRERTGTPSLSPARRYARAGGELLLAVVPRRANPFQITMNLDRIDPNS